MGDRSRLFAVFTLAACAALPVSGEGPAPRLALPVACTPGENCWVVNYMDLDPAENQARDFQCGPRSYDGHTGTDFAIRDWAALERGVDVLAAADGKVLRMRDGVPDRVLSDGERKQVLAAKRGCGNGVVMEHEGGWQTMYCHMKQGSIAVRSGDAVKASQKIGQVGQSGNAEFPHLHLGVTAGGDNIDPFTGRAAKAGCGSGESLWREGAGTAYEPVALYAAGFRGEVPDFDRINRDASSPESLPANAGALTFWLAFYGALKGDRILLRITAPGGGVLAEQRITQEKDRARQFYFVGKRNSAGRLAPGTYTGTAVLTRTQPGGAPLERRLTRTISIQ